MDGENLISDGFQTQARQQATPLLQGDADLIYSFSEPSAKDFKKEYEHINKDFRMSNLNELDEDYINKASIAMVMAQTFLMSDSPCVKNVLHDMFMVANISVGRKGFAMQTLITKKLQQVASFEKKSSGFMSNKDKDGEY